MPSQIISSQYSTTGTSDSIASSYRPSAQLRPRMAQTSRENFSNNYSENQVSDELIHHPTIMKLQQQNFHRLLSSAESTTTSSSSMLKQHQPMPIRSDREDDQGTYISSMTATTTTAAAHNPIPSIQPSSDNQRAALHQRKQALMKAIQSINKQMEDLDM